MESAGFRIMELIEGELVEAVSPRGRLHGRVLSKLNSILDTEIVDPALGELLAIDAVWLGGDGIAHGVGRSFTRWSWGEI